jgi:hypothetical protein
VVAGYRLYDTESDEKFLGWPPLVGPADDLAEVEAAWAREIARRARRVMSGESTGEAWEDVRARVMQRLADR